MFWATSICCDRDVGVVVGVRCPSVSSPLLTPSTKFFPLVEQIGLGRAQVDNLRTAIAVLLEQRALLAVVGIAHARPTANHAAALVRAIVALVADTHQRRRPHIRIADDTLAVALFAQTPNGDAGLLAAKDQIGMMTGHRFGGKIRIGKTDKTKETRVKRQQHTRWVPFTKVVTFWRRWRPLSALMQTVGGETFSGKTSVPL